MGTRPTSTGIPDRGIPVIIGVEYDRLGQGFGIAGQIDNDDGDIAPFKLNELCNTLEKYGAKEIIFSEVNRFKKEKNEIPGELELS